MRILFISHNFPPEVNALATRLHEHAKQWVHDGHEVEVITDVPNFPEGEVYDGYQNRLSYEVIDGIGVTRVPLYIAENKGTLRRTLGYLSFMLSAIWNSRTVKQHVDVVVASSPQFFSALAGYAVAKLRRVPFVLEIRDLWPESIIAVGAMPRNGLIRLFETLEHFLYRKADHIVAVTDAFKTYIEKKGIAPDKISVLKNGADLALYTAPLDPAVLDDLRQRYGLDGQFVVSYIGTIGMAHRADVLLEAAQLCADPDVVFMVVGTGAEREALARRAATLNLSNFRLVEKQPRHLVRYFLALSDVSVVHLRDSPLFRTVIPSKIFEAMAMKKPIVLGVEGETRAIIEAAEAGIPVPPEQPATLVEAVVRLRRDPPAYAAMAESGFRYVHEHFDRKALARAYAALLECVAVRTARV